VASARSAELARGREQIAELDRAVALDARHRRFAERVAVGEIVDHLFAKAALVIEHVMRDADPLGDVAGIVNVAPGAAGALAMGGGAVVVELQRDADHVITLGLQQRKPSTEESRARRTMATTILVSLRAAFEFETVEHGRGHRS